MEASIAYRYKPYIPQQHQLMFLPQLSILLPVQNLLYQKIVLRLRQIVVRYAALVCLLLLLFPATATADFL